MPKASIISVSHFKDRVTRGVQKDECIVVYFKMSDRVNEQPQMAVLYPKEGASRDVLNATFLDSVDIVLGPSSRDLSRNQVVDIRFAGALAVS